MKLDKEVREKSELLCICLFACCLLYIAGKGVSKKNTNDRSTQDTKIEINKDSIIPIEKEDTLIVSELDTNTNLATYFFGKTLLTKNMKGEIKQITLPDTNLQLDKGDTIIAVFNNSKMDPYQVISLKRQR